MSEVVNELLETTSEAPSCSYACACLRCRTLSLQCHSAAVGAFVIRACTGCTAPYDLFVNFPEAAVRQRTVRMWHQFGTVRGASVGSKEALTWSGSHCHCG
jgi:hypothetical protein